jgi:hypothetical protein
MHVLARLKRPVRRIGVVEGAARRRRRAEARNGQDKEDQAEGSHGDSLCRQPNDGTRDEKDSVLHLRLKVPRACLLKESCYLLATPRYDLHPPLQNPRGWHRRPVSVSDRPREC